MLRRRHDFVVVETIDFYADEDAELPPPMSQRDVVALNNAAGMEEEEAPADAAADGASGQARNVLHLPSCFISFFPVCFWSASCLSKQVNVLGGVPPAP